MSRKERELGAYRDGELRGAERERVRSRLSEDPAAALELERVNALGGAVRAAWSEGPPAPAAEFVIQALRPELARIDRERAARRSWWRRSPLELLAPLRSAQAMGLAGTLAAALVIVFLQTPGPGLQGVPVSPEADLMASFGAPSSIYDLEQARDPLLIYELADGVTVIWMLEEEPAEKLSSSSANDFWV